MTLTGDRPFHTNIIFQFKIKKAVKICLVQIIRASFIKKIVARLLTEL